jgi:cysteine desulfurase/selenocysteine lyase
MSTTIQHTSNTTEVRKDFPILNETVNGKPLVYLDNGATAQKPVQVISAIDSYYKEYNSNIHRGVHHLSQLATEKYEEAREKLRGLINAEHKHEVILTSGTTQGINLVAYSFGKAFVKEGDEVLISAMEHHSNIVPWQIMCEDRGAKLKVVQFNDKGELDFELFKDLLNEKTKLVAITHVSNSLGSINPVKDIIKAAHAFDVPVLLDGAQAVPHMAVDVQDLDVDFYVFSGHKMFAPTGTGVLYGKEEWLNAMPPYLGGGEMIETVTFEKTTYNSLPHKFEAGTPNIAGVIGLGAAVDYINTIGYATISKHEADLLQYAQEKLSGIEGLKAIGTAAEKASVFSFIIEGVHPYDVGSILDKLGVAVRTGHHCTQPVMDYFKIPGTIRASFAFYNTFEEIDILFNALSKAVNMLK